MIVKDIFDKIETKTTIGKPLTPSTWVGEPKYYPITRIKMTCGGGMGGSSWYEYVERFSLNDISDRPLGTMWRIKTVDGNEKLINPNYVVEVDSEITMVCVTFDSRNPHFEKGIYTYRFLYRDGTKVSLSDRFG